jgi:mediator of RNA polymerase II transcription subunit 13
MDFPRQCTTNVHAVTDALGAHYFVFEHKSMIPNDLEKWTVMSNAVAALRQQGICCAASGADIYCFSLSESRDILSLQIWQPSFILKMQGTVREALASSQQQGRRMEDLLLESFEASLSCTLARESGMLRIKPWTWLRLSNRVQPAASESFSVEVKAHIASDGSLILLPTVKSSTAWALVQDLTQAGRGVVLAPFGVTAYAFDTAGVSAHDEGLRKYIRQLLACQGIALPAMTKWLTVQSQGVLSKPFIWPKHLCLLLSDLNLGLNRSDNAFDWKNWFQVNEEGSFKDPLSVAEQWVLSATARESDLDTTVANNVHGNDAALDAPTKNAPEIDVTVTDLIASPPFNQRLADQQAAMSGIYPTPPDGLTQMSTAVQFGLYHGSSDNQNETEGTAEESILNGNDLDYRIQRYDSTASQPLLPLDQVSSFGPREDIEFAENDIEDEDFNFFDEPDDDRAVAHIDDVSMSESMTAVDDHGQAYNLSADDKDEDQGMSASDSVVPASPLEQEAMDISNRQQSQMHDDTGAEATAGKGSQPPPQKPLSPFGVKERLFPPPIPASVAQGARHGYSDAIKEGTYGRVVFRDGLNFAAKYGPSESTPSNPLSISRFAPSISLPPRTRKSSKTKPKLQDSPVDEDASSDSDADLCSTASSESKISSASTKPLEDRKRKRKSLFECAQPQGAIQAYIRPGDDNSKALRGEASDSIALKLVQQISQFDLSIRKDMSAPTHVPTLDLLGMQVKPLQPHIAFAFSVEDVDALNKQDLIFVAQLAGAQAATCLALRNFVDDYGNEPSRVDNSMYLPILLGPLNRAMEAVFPGANQFDIGQAALVREPLNRAATNPGKGPVGTPRPPQRSDTTIAGPDYFNLPAPHIRIRRSSDNWDMLPPCLHFWETLGLGPASGTKDVRAFCVFPKNSSLEDAIKRFLTDLGSVFDRCKLGTHVYQRQTNGKDRLDVYDDGMAPVAVEDDFSLPGVLKAYSRTCTKLGKALATMQAADSGCTIVVYMINPFPQAEAMQYLCACFWMLFKSYRDRLPKADSSAQAADILVQIVPINLVASMGAITIPGERQMALLARQVYDRCPPSPSAINKTASALPILAAPSVELAGPTSKRVQFQLTEHPSGDLMHEGSLLHLAYSRSPDQHWLNAVWMDNTGQHQSSAVFCVRGRSFADAAQEMWDRTREILEARQVMWRVYIVTDSDLDRPSVQFWQHIASQPRAQLLCVTLLSVRTDPDLLLSLPLPADLSSANGVDFGAFTPAATPQGANSVNSPEVGGHLSAPPTPAPSEPAVPMTEIDPDANLVDLADESWAMLLCPKLLQMVNRHAMATGILFQRGDTDASGGVVLPSVGISLYWTIQVKPSGLMDVGLPKHAEMALREVMKMYRSLAVLTSARGLDIGNTALLPVHMAVAAQGVTGLDGMLRAS